MEQIGHWVVLHRFRPSDCFFFCFFFSVAKHHFKGLALTGESDCFVGAGLYWRLWSPDTVDRQTYRETLRLTDIQAVGEFKAEQTHASQHSCSNGFRLEIQSSVRFDIISAQPSEDNMMCT